MSADAVNEALANLKESLFGCFPDDSKTGYSIAESEIDCHPAESEDIKSIHASRDNFGEATAPTGGEFVITFPGIAGREAARLEERVIMQAFTEDVWEQMWRMSPNFKKKFKSNPKRTSDPDHPDNGYIRFVVTDREAGLFARSLNEMAQKIRHHSRKISAVMQVAEQYGSDLQGTGLCKLWPAIDDLMGKENPKVHLRFDVAKGITTNIGGPSVYDQLKKAGIVTEDLNSGFHHRNNSKGDAIPAIKYDANLSQLSAVERILSGIQDNIDRNGRH